MYTRGRSSLKDDVPLESYTSCLEDAADYRVRRSAENGNYPKIELLDQLDMESRAQSDASVVASIDTHGDMVAVNAVEGTEHDRGKSSTPVDSRSQHEDFPAEDCRARELGTSIGGNSSSVAVGSDLVEGPTGATKLADPTVAIDPTLTSTSEEKYTIRKERQECAPIAESVQIKARRKAGRKKPMRRVPRRKAKEGCDARGDLKCEKTPVSFDEWVGGRLKAWRDGETVEPGGGLPPRESGVKEEIDFETSKDEIEFPTSLSAVQRRQVHNWAMQLTLFHASSGEDTQRHVIVSKTGVFHNKLLTQGGRAWYVEGVTAPDVKRFALQPGFEQEGEPLVAALRGFRESMQQQRESGFAKWLAAHAPGPLDGSDLAQAQDSMRTWPLLDVTEWEFVETPEKLASLVTTLNSCKEFGFDMEAHNARTYHGLTCLLQISTKSKDFIVDPLVEGMWESMTQLRGPFANPDILKIGHSIRSCDIPSLFRDFGIVVVNAFDTEEAVHALGEKHSGLARVLKNAGIEELHDIAGLKHIMQVCDWRERPLSGEKLLYARCDSHFLIPLWWLMRARLLGADTFANHEESKKERDILALEEPGRQYKVSGDGDERDGGASSETLDTKAAVIRMSTSGGTWDDIGEGNAHDSGRVIGPEPPVPIEGEHRTTDWDDPKHCHRRERSRSGSFFRSDLESIEENAADQAMRIGDGSTSSSSTRRKSFRVEVSELAAAVPEAPDEGEIGLDGGGAEVGASGAVGNLLPLDLGENLIGNEELEVQSENFKEDEDEDLWDGWGHDTCGMEGEGEGEGGGGGEATSAAGANKITREFRVDGATVSTETVSTPAIVSPGTPETAYYTNVGSNSIDSKNSSASEIPITAKKSKKNKKHGGRKGRKGLKIAALPNDQHIVHTDGVRLMWKAFYRTQLATAVLWHPASEASRQDSHKERNFRKSIQRLTPPRWSEDNIRVYEDIYLWRDQTARRMDDGVSYVCPGDILIDIALTMPKTLDELRRISFPLSPVLGEANTPEAKELIKVIRAALELPEEQGQGHEAALGIENKGA